MTDSSKQGNLGLADSIKWFIAEGYKVSLPISDTQYYDLLVEKDNLIYKIQVKTTKSIRKRDGKKGYFRISLSRGKSLSDHLDFVYVLTSNNERYLIPKKDIKSKKDKIILYPKFDKYKVSEPFWNGK